MAQIQIDNCVTKNSLHNNEVVSKAYASSRIATQIVINEKIFQRDLSAFEVYSWSHDEHDPVSDYNNYKPVTSHPTPGDSTDPKRVSEHSYFLIWARSPGVRKITKRFRFHYNFFTMFRSLLRWPRKITSWWCILSVEKTAWSVITTHLYNWLQNT